MKECHVCMAFHHKDHYMQLSPLVADVWRTVPATLMQTRCSCIQETFFIAGTIVCSQELTCYGLRLVEQCLGICTAHVDPSNWDSQEDPLQSFPCKWTEWSVPSSRLFSLSQFGHNFFPDSLGGKCLGVSDSSYIPIAESVLPLHLLQSICAKGPKLWTELTVWVDDQIDIKVAKHCCAVTQWPSLDDVINFELCEVLL